MAPAAFYQFTARGIDGRTVSLDSYRGMVCLIVNVASECGFTPQYTGLERLFQQYRDRGFVVLGFPCNQFGRQEPGDEAAIQSFCEVNFGVTFPLFARVEVNGTGAHPLFTWLKSQRRGILGTRAIKWNFTKFLVDRSGQVRRRFGPRTTPGQIEPHLQALLA